jgi:hypothetical protein
MNRFSLRHLAVLSLALSPAAARGQFPGDVFFAQPSVAAAEGGTATLDVVTFAGTTVYGGVHFELQFDPERMEIEKVEAGASAYFDFLVSRSQAGRVNVIVINSRSLTSPIGTSSLARLTVRPKGDAGEVVPLALGVKGIVDSASAPVAKPQGYGAEIVITSPAPPDALAKAAEQNGPERKDAAPKVLEGPLPRDLEIRASRLGRRGQVLRLTLLESESRRSGVRAQSVMVKVPGAASETDA